MTRGSGNTAITITTSDRDFPEGEHESQPNDPFLPENEKPSCSTIAYNAAMSTGWWIKNASIPLSSLVIGFTYASLAAEHGGKNLPWQLAYFLSSFTVNFLGAVVLFQRAEELLNAITKRYRDPAYDACIIASLILAIMATIPSVPLSNDGLDNALVNQNSFLYSLFSSLNSHQKNHIKIFCDLFFAASVTTSTFVGAMDMTYSLYFKTIMSYCQPERYLLRQTYEDICSKKYNYPSNSPTQINDACFAAVYAKKNSIPEPSTLSRVGSYAEYGLCFFFFFAAKLMMPLWLHLTQRGNGKLFGVDSTLSIDPAWVWFSSIARQLFYERSLYKLPGDLTNSIKSLSKTIPIIVVILLCLASVAIAYLSGAGLGQEGFGLSKESNFDSVARDTFLSWMKLYALLQAVHSNFFGRLCWTGAALVNLGFIPTTVNSCIALKTKYPEVPTAKVVLEKFLPVFNLKDTLSADVKQKEKILETLEFGNAEPNFNFQDAKAARVAKEGEELGFVDKIKRCLPSYIPTFFCKRGADSCEGGQTGIASNPFSEPRR